jgi:hypothetical protein
MARFSDTCRTFRSHRGRPLGTSGPSRLDGPWLRSHVLYVRETRQPICRSFSRQSDMALVDGWRGGILPPGLSQHQTSNGIIGLTCCDVWHGLIESPQPPPPPHSLTEYECIWSISRNHLAARACSSALCTIRKWQFFTDREADPSQGSSCRGLAWQP